jgi:regulator of sigma E protease
VHTFARASALPDVTQKYAGKTVTFVLLRNGKQVEKTVTLRSDAAVAASRKTDNPKGHLGVLPSELTLQRSTWSAPVVAGGLMGQFTALTFQGLGKALAGLGGIIAGAVTGNTDARQAAQTEASSQVAGPVGIFFVLKSGSILGYQYVLFVIAIISLTLAIMNFLPIPALDGGRMWLTLISRAFKRPLTPRTEELVNATGFLLLIGLIILISVVDVRRFF